MDAAVSVSGDQPAPELSREQVWVVCRACLRQAEGAVALAAAPRGLPPLSAMLLETTRLRAPPDRPLPQKLCRLCADTLCALYSFRQMCLESHRRLTLLLDHADCRLPLPPQSSPMVDVDLEVADPEWSLPPPKTPPKLYQSRTVQTQPVGDHCSVCKLDPRTYGVSTPKSKINHIPCPKCSKVFTKRLRFKKHMIEQHHFKKKDIKYPNNVIFPTVISFNCKTCHYVMDNRTEYNEHISTCSLNGKFETQTSDAEDVPIFNYKTTSSLADVAVKSEPIDDLINGDDFDNRDDDDFNGDDEKFDQAPCDLVEKTEKIWDPDNADISNHNALKFSIETRPSPKSIAKLVKVTKDFVCKVCSKRFSTKMCLRRHTAIHNEDTKPYRCPVCGKSFAKEGHRKRHIITHDSVKRFKCDFCNKAFHRKDNMQTHMRVHLDANTFHCGSCEQTFSSETQMIHHRISEHVKRKQLPKTAFCPICNQGFVREKSLKVHLNIHNGEKLLECNICSKQFHTKWQLTDHMKTHLGQKNYLCSECGQGFSRKDYFTVHMRRHTGDNPYKCKFCGKGFPRQTDVKAHEKYHTGERTHICNVCGVGFTRPYSLKVHLRVHTGEKPYVCKHCGRKFTQPYDLKLHVRRHTGERINCDICSKEFIQGYLLRQHKRSAHGISTSSRIHRLDKSDTKDNSIEEESMDFQEEEC